MNKIIITGMNGFVAPYLARHINGQGNFKFYGIVRKKTKVPEFVNLLECDLKDFENVKKIVKKIKPNYIFHLAAQSSVKQSWNKPQEVLINNIIPAINLLEAVKQFAPDCIIHLAGSAEEYGNSSIGLINEDQPLNPLSVYGVSKVAQEKLGFQYYKNFGLKVILTRAFNHTGPGRDKRFAEASFALQIASCDNPVIKVGNLEAVRDFTDVSDVVRAYWDLANTKFYGKVFNVCSGTGHSIKEVLDKLIDISGKKVEIKKDEERLRPSDIPRLVGFPNRLRNSINWKLKYDFDKTLKDLYENTANS